MSPDTTHPYLDETLKLLKQLIAFETVSQDSNIEMISFCVDYLRKAGAEVSVWISPDETKANCFATFSSMHGEKYRNGIVLSGHSDVVPVEGQTWSHKPFSLEENEGRLYGRGTCDMKGFIACCLAMGEVFEGANLKRPVHIALTYEEETGCLGGQQLVKDLVDAGIRPSVCIVGEPTSMRIVEGHKGCYEYRTCFEGLATHGSLTHQGVNAIEYAALYITKLMEIREELKNSTPEGQRFTPPYTTLQIGEIRGGVSRNTIAGDCTVDWEMRPVRIEDADHVKSSISKYIHGELLPAMRERAPNAWIRTETIGEIVGLVPANENEARDICFALTGNEEAEVVSFGTEAGLFQQFGMSVVICGPGSIEQAHKPDEYIEIDELDRCLSMLEKLCEYVSE